MNLVRKVAKHAGLAVVAPVLAIASVSIVFLLLVGTAAQATTTTVSGSGDVPSGSGGANDIEIVYYLSGPILGLPVETAGPITKTNLPGAGSPTDTLPNGYGPPQPNSTPGRVIFSTTAIAPASTASKPDTISWTLKINRAVVVDGWWFTYNNTDINTSSGGKDFTNQFAKNGGWTYTTTPVPATMLLLGPGLVGLAAVRRRLKK
jgi:hypothetical protein